ncbi:MAG: SigB/SigF/SigG family RNA polymerase sigma factor [Pseudonocardiales bacterium]|nr:SigB/SigF/SigG family RNA polymerase sigma factor [Pseudonocardiales bacterium]
MAAQTVADQLVHCTAKRTPRRRIHGATTVTTSVSPDGTRSDEYAHLVALHRRYAQSAPDDPEHQQLRGQLISGYLRVAENIARRFAGRGEPLDDLVQVATVGLINAVDRYEPARGSDFLCFAVPTITGEIRSYFRDHSSSTRVPRRLQAVHLAIRRTLAELSQQLKRAPRPSEIADRLGLPTSEVIEGLQAAEAYRCMSLDDPVSGAAARGEVIGSLDHALARIEDRETLRPLLAQLPSQDRTILALRFFYQLTQTQIAEQVGVSQMQVSRALRQTLAFLHEHTSD